MKKIIVILTLILSIGSSQTIQAKVIHINLTVNLDRQPSWGPAGYDFAPYYYIPALDIYYEVNTARFYYRNGPVWVHATLLPAAYRKYNLHTCYKVVLKEPTPWVYNKQHRVTYKNYKKAPVQVTNRKSPAYHSATRNLRETRSSNTPRVGSTQKQSASNNRATISSQKTPSSSFTQTKEKANRAVQEARTKSGQGKEKETSTSVKQNRTSTSNRSSTTSQNTQRASSRVGSQTSRR